uniref:Nrap protein domain-containing protein n=1 Tax=Octactis speculum TaxID=3111310 RepID=A0A7S2CVP9_9STRA
MKKNEASSGLNGMGVVKDLLLPPPPAVFGASILLTIHPHMAYKPKQKISASDKAREKAGAAAAGTAGLHAGNALGDALRQGPIIVQKQIARSYANVGKHARKSSIQTLVGFDPVRDCLQALRQRFHEVALFFMDALENDVILVVFRPAFFLPQPLVRTAGVGDRLVVTPAAKTKNKKRESFHVPHVLQVMDDMREIGAGVVNHAQFVTS